MRKNRLFSGRNLLIISSADPINVIRRLNATGAEIFNVTQVDEFTMQLETSKQPDSSILPILERYADKYQIIRRQTFVNILQSFIKRPFILFETVILLLLTLYLPTHVLFVQVNGNANIPKSQIISVACTCGIRLGASRKEVRSEQIKNQMLSALPQLEWIGVNTYGCVAEISVRERAVPEENRKNHTIGSIVASRDGIILDCTTSQGTQLCKPGQAVTKGQLLVSGYTGCGAYIQGALAEADIHALTTRKLTIVVPNTMYGRNEVIRSERRFRLIIGNILINFYKDSGISPTTCVKIQKEHPLTLPGGFTLPICIVEEQVTHYKFSPAEAETIWAYESGQEYLKSQMIAGKILSKDVLAVPGNGATEYEGTYFCTEMIGQLKIEETI